MIARSTVKVHGTTRCVQRRVGSPRARSRRLGRRRFNQKMAAKRVHKTSRFLARRPGIACLRHRIVNQIKTTTTVITRSCTAFVDLNSVRGRAVTLKASLHIPLIGAGMFVKHSVDETKMGVGRIQSGVKKRMIIHIIRKMCTGQHIRILGGTQERRIR